MKVMGHLRKRRQRGKAKAAMTFTLAPVEG
jgi:hypothetical protein